MGVVSRLTLHRYGVGSVPSMKESILHATKLLVKTCSLLSQLETFWPWGHYWLCLNCLVVDPIVHSCTAILCLCYYPESAVSARVEPCTFTCYWFAGSTTVLPLYPTRELLQTATAADFYAVMAQFGERLRRAQLLPSTEFMQVCVCVHVVGGGKGGGGGGKGGGEGSGQTDHLISTFALKVWKTCILNRFVRL